ncbi:hypothetical protein ACLK19_10085 [Escherichia coli]
MTNKPTLPAQWCLVYLLYTWGEHMVVQSKAVQNRAGMDMEKRVSDIEPKTKKQAFALYPLRWPCIC